VGLYASSVTKDFWNDIEVLLVILFGNPIKIQVIARINQNNVS